MNRNRSLRMLIVLTALIIQFSCVAQNLELQKVELELVEDAQLRKSIELYYEHEANSNWETTYKLRSGVFTETVPIGLYLRKMRENAQGWSLKAITAVNIEKNNEFDYDVYIEFQSDRSGIHQRYTQRTNWLKESNEWKANIPGKRGLFILNDWVKQ